MTTHQIPPNLNSSLSSSYTTTYSVSSHIHHVNAASTHFNAPQSELTDMNFTIVQSIHALATQLKTSSLILLVSCLIRILMYLFKLPVLQAECVCARLISLVKSCIEAAYLERFLHKVLVTS